MRYAVFSDIHSNQEALQAVINSYKKESIDKFFCVGDIVGYASDAANCIKLVRDLTEVTVAGNHDWASVGLFSLDYFNALAKEAICWTKDRLNANQQAYLKSLKLLYQNDDFVLVHGTLTAPGDFNYLTSEPLARQSFGRLKKQVCFIGHSHVAGVFIREQSGEINYQSGNFLKIEKQKKYIVNVGSVGQPRDGDPKAAYCIYDSRRREIQIKRVSYDIDKTADKIMRAGLPKFLAERLGIGR